MKSGNSLAVSILSLLTAAALTVVLLLLSSSAPGKSVIYFFTGPFRNIYNFGNMLDEAGLLILAGSGMSIAFRAGVFNLGGEGQIYAGASASVLTALALAEAGRYTGITVSITTGIAAGALIAGVSGWLKKKWETDELISSFLLAGVVSRIIDYLISGPFRDSSSFLISTRQIPEQYHLSALAGSSHLNIGFIIAVAASVLAYIFLFRTSPGYEIRISGLNRRFAHYGGIPAGRHYVLPMLISGGLYGAAGAFTVLGNYHSGIQGATAGMGWNGIAVALIAGSNPVLVIPAALIFAWLDSGAQLAMIHSDLSFELSNIIRAVIFFLITARGIRKGKGGGK